MVDVSFLVTSGLLVTLFCIFAFGRGTCCIQIVDDGLILLLHSLHIGDFVFLNR